MPEGRRSTTPLSGARFPAGPQTVSGADALAFVRQRHGLPEGDLSRIRRQQVFLAAVADKVLAGGTLTDPAKLAGLVEVAQQSVVLDAGWDLLAFARQASGIAAGNLEFLTVPDPGPRDQRPGQRGARRPGAGARLRRAAHRRAGGGRAPAAEAAAAPAPEPPPPLDDRGAALRRGRAQRLGRERAGRAGAGAAHAASASSAARWTTRPTPRRRWSATPRQRRRGRRGRRAARRVRGGAGRRRRPGHLQVVLGADATRPMIPGLPGADARRPTPAAAPIDHGRQAYRASTDRRPFRRGPVTLTAALLDPYLSRLRGRPAADHLLRRRDRRARRAVRDDHRELGREGRQPAARRVRRRAGHAGRRAAARALADGGGAAGGVVVRRGGRRRPAGGGLGAVRRRPGRPRAGGRARGRGAWRCRSTRSARACPGCRPGSSTSPPRCGCTATSSRPGSRSPARRRRSRARRWRRCWPTRAGRAAALGVGADDRVLSTLDWSTVDGADRRPARRAGRGGVAGAVPQRGPGRAGAAGGGGEGHRPARLRIAAGWPCSNPIAVRPPCCKPDAGHA